MGRASEPANTEGPSATKAETKFDILKNKLRENQTVAILMVLYFVFVELGHVVTTSVQIESFAKRIFFERNIATYDEHVVTGLLNLYRAVNAHTYELTRGEPSTFSREDLKKYSGWKAELDALNAITQAQPHNKLSEDMISTLHKIIALMEESNHNASKSVGAQMKFLQGALKITMAQIFVHEYSKKRAEKQ